MSSENKADAHKYYMTATSQALAMLLAITCVGQFCISILALLTPDELITWDEYWPMTVMIVPGLMILKYMNMPPRYTIFSYAVFCGIFQLLSAVNHMDSLDLIDYIDMFMGLMMITSGTHCLFGDRHSASRLLVISLAVLMIDLSGIVVALVYIIGVGTGFVAFALSSLSTISEIVYMTFLVKRDVREEGVDSTLKESMSAIEAMMTNGHEAYMFRDELDPMLGIDRSGWTDYESGPIASSYVASVFDDKKRFTITSKVWRTTGEMMISVDQDLKTVSYGRGFILRSHAIENAEEGEYIRLYGDEGMYLRILMKDRPKKRSFLDRLDHKTESDDDLLEDPVKLDD